MFLNWHLHHDGFCPQIFNSQEDKRWVFCLFSIIKTVGEWRSHRLLHRFVRWIKWSLMFRHAMFRQSIPTCLWALCFWGRKGLMRFEMYNFFIFSSWDEMFLPLASTCQMQILHLSAVVHNLYHTKLYHTKRKYLTLWLKFGVGEKKCEYKEFLLKNKRKKTCKKKDFCFDAITSKNLQ